MKSQDQNRFTVELPDDLWAFFGDDVVEIARAAGFLPDGNVKFKNITRARSTRDG